ncbi:MAG: Lysine exporter protein [Firmicutes bacterium]|nr:Lysine exporter protein [Bacillota bacterium]
MLLWIKGIVLGFSIAAPVGPIGVLCIRRTLANGMKTGFISGLGAATADAIYGFIAALGLSVISTFLLDYQFYLRLIGGGFLLYLGYTTCKSMPAEEAASVNGKGLLGAYTSTLFLTITNPMTIMSFAAVFAGLGMGPISEKDISSFFLVFGVFIGSMLWWLILSGTVNVLRNTLEQKQLKWVNRLSGLIIACFGIFSLVSV